MTLIHKIGKFAKKRVKNVMGFFTKNKNLILGYSLSLPILMLLLDGTSSILSILYSSLWALSFPFLFISISVFSFSTIHTIYRFLRRKMNKDKFSNAIINKTNIESNEKNINNTGVNYNLELLKNVYKNDEKSLKKLLKKHSNVEIK